jgi:hypothetical protein
MKTLFLGRHAKSSWDDSGLSDFERPLNDRGERDAPEMGRRLAEKHRTADVILCSAAVRARTTAAILAKEWGYEGDLLLEPKLYEASSSQMLDFIQEMEDEATSALVHHLAGQPSGKPLHRQRAHLRYRGLENTMQQLVGGGGGTGGTHRVRLPEKSGSLSRRADHYRLTRPGQRSDRRCSRRTSGGNVAQNRNPCDPSVQTAIGNDPFKIDPVPAISSACCENFF